MNCYLHPDREATAYCRSCGRALCAEDQREIYGVVYCQECLARQVGVAPPPSAASGAGGEAGAAAAGAAAAPVYAAAPAGHKPSPGLALALGFIPGVGAVYNGQYLKAFVQVVIFAFLIAMTNNANDVVGTFFGIGIACFYCYMVIDSYRTAKQMQAGLPVQDFFSLGNTPSVNAPVAAIILIVVGAIFLLKSMNFFDYESSKYFWPVILIAIGIYVLVRQQNKRAS
ncbi:MAG: LiaI-LiaF-like domain-containing protein [Terriglobales bacterium]